MYMNTSTTFSLKLLLTGLATATLITGCALEEMNEPLNIGPQEETEYQTITAETIAQLPAGEILVVDTTPMNKLTIFDRTLGDIDYSRIELICPNGNIMLMDEWVAQQVQEFGSRFMSRSRSVLAADPYRFGLNERQVEILQTQRFYTAPPESSTMNDIIGNSGPDISKNPVGDTIQKGESSDCYYCCSDGIYDCDPPDEAP